MNEHLFDGINSLAGRSDAVDATARFLANDGIYLLGGLLAILGVVELRRNPRFGLQVAAAAAIALGLTGALILVAGHLIIEQRPFVGDADTVLLIKHVADNGFPSDHASVSAAAAVVGMFAWPRWAGLLALLVIASGLARVVVGVHFPGDVAAGWLAGGAIAGLAWVTVHRVSERLGWAEAAAQPGAAG